MKPMFPYAVENQQPPRLIISMMESIQATPTAGQPKRRIIASRDRQPLAAPAILPHENGVLVCAVAGVTGVAGESAPASYLEPAAP